MRVLFSYTEGMHLRSGMGNGSVDLTFDQHVRTVSNLSPNCPETIPLLWLFDCLIVRWVPVVRQWLWHALHSSKKNQVKTVSGECPWEEYQMKKDGADGPVLVMDVNGISNDGE
jgi:hypothetical protein